MQPNSAAYAQSQDVASYDLSAPFKTWLQVTQACNLDCRHAYDECPDEPLSTEMAPATLRAVIDDLAATGVIHVLIEGGEPLLRKDLIELVKHARPKMMCWIRTNGTLVDEGVAAQLKEAGVETVIVDVLADTADVHDRITRSPGSFSRTIRGIESLVAVGIPVMVATILLRQNSGRLQQLAGRVHAMGVNRFAVLRLYPIGNALENWSALAPTLEAQMAAVRGLDPPEGLEVMQSWHPNDPNCCWQNSGIRADGRSVGCAYLRSYVDYGDAARDGMMSTWDNPLWRHLRSGAVSDSCPDCEATQGMGGGCRSTAFAFHQDWDAPDPYCTRLNGGLDVSIQPG